MKARLIGSRWRASIFALSIVPAATAAAQDPAGARASARSLVRAMSAAAAAPVDARYSPSTGYATFLSFRSGGLPFAASGGVEARTRSFLEAYGAAFGFGPESEARIASHVPSDAVGQEHVRLQQTFQGVPVVAGELMLHFRQGKLVAANGRALPGVAVDTTPSVAPERAEEAVRETLRKHLDAEAVELSVPELQILNRGLLEGVTRPTHLAWFVVATSPTLRQFAWVDAHRGGVLLHFSQRPEAKKRTVFDDSQPNPDSIPDLPGTLVRSEGDPESGDPDADAAYRHAGDTYDYFWTQHGRDSYDGAGHEIRSTVHYCVYGYCPYPNAFWNGAQMVYGEGYPAADDVVAHELTHAVTEHSANLFYYMQSGALNESFSDIFGETVDLTNGSGNDTAGVRWQMGEDIPVHGAIRNMMDPTLFGDPGKASDPRFDCGGSNGYTDGGGVHTNSGVPNHAYALMVDGGSYNGFTVTRHRPRRRPAASSTGH